jgi:hypothetical protein
MTDLLTPSPSLALRALIVCGALTLALSGCSAGASDTSADTDTSAGTDTSSSSSDSGADDDAGSGDDDDEVTVIGEDLPSYTGLLLATNYAESRDPHPTVEFLDATSVKFTFPEEYPLEQSITNCQIAWGSLSGEGIHVYITSGSVEQDCTAEMEG